MTPGLYLGIDAGATHSRLLARTVPGGAEVVLDGDAANLKRRGLEATTRVLAGLAEAACRQAPDAPLRALCAGVAGAGSETDRAALEAALAARFPDAAVRIVHDAVIALEGAFEGGSGAIVIAGTGSIVFARTAGGRVERAGGWGYLLGDEGSGHALGLAGLRALAHALDGGPATQLRDALADSFGLTTPEALIQAVYDAEWPVQEAAPLVVEAAAAGDAVARHIVETQVSALAAQVAWLASRADEVTPRVALLGGLMREPFYRERLTAALHEVLPAWTVQPTQHPAVFGALRLALALG